MHTLGRTRFLITTFKISSAKTNGYAIWNCPDEGVVTPDEVSCKLAVQNKRGDGRIEIVIATEKYPPKEGTWIQTLDLTLSYHWTLYFVSCDLNEDRLDDCPTVYLVLQVY